MALARALYSNVRSCRHLKPIRTDGSLIQVYDQDGCHLYRLGGFEVDHDEPYYGGKQLFSHRIQGESLSEEQRNDATIVPPESATENCEVCVQVDADITDLMNELWKKLKAE